MIKAVLFDLDGTLIDSLSDLADATNRVLQNNGFAPRPKEAFPYYVGNGIPKMIERALPDAVKDAETVNRLTKEFLAYYGQHYADKTVAFDGMPELITDLKKNGLRLAVVTNKAQEMAEAVVKKLYGEKTFDLIFGKRADTPAKPDPTVSRSVMETFGVLPEECAFLGDSGVDMQTARNCGALPIGVLWGYRNEAELRENGVQFLIQKPKEFLKVLDEVL